LDRTVFSSFYLVFYNVVDPQLKFVTEAKTLLKCSF